MAWDMRRLRARLRGAALNIAVEAISAAAEEIIRTTPEGNPPLWKNPRPRRTPYRPGDLRASWKSSLDAPDVSITEAKRGRREAFAIREAKSVAKRINYGTRYFYMVNALPYARKIEYMGHSSRQAPSGMMRVTASRFGRFVQAAARRR